MQLFWSLQGCAGVVEEFPKSVVLVNLDTGAALGVQNRFREVFQVYGELDLLVQPSATDGGDAASWVAILACGASGRRGKAGGLRGAGECWDEESRWQGRGALCGR
jgi:hypothetical protein